MSLVIENKKARFLYQILEKYQAGIVLNGQEVKSIKRGGLNLRGSFVVLKNNEVFLIGAIIPPYQPKNIQGNYDPRRSRKLLLKKSEIKHLFGKTKQKGLTMIPLKVYTQKGRIKLEFALAKGKRKVDKRAALKKKEINKEIQRAFKEKNRGGARL